MDASYHRHDISDAAWELIAPYLPGQRGQWGGIAKDNRRFINAVFWVRSSTRLWEMGYGTPAVYPLAQKRDLGETSGNLD